MKPKTFLFLLTPMLFATNLLAQDGIKPIIDMHLHGYSERTYQPGPLELQGASSPKTYEEFKKEMLAMFKKYNIVKAMVDAPGGEHDWGDDRFIYGYKTLVPPPVEDTVEFKRMIEAGEINVFGEIGAQYAGYTLSDPEFEPYLSICERYDIPVAVHMIASFPNTPYNCCPKFRLSLGDPFTIEDALVKYPKLRIYMMHAGAGFLYEERTLAIMSMYTHVYGDLGVSLWSGTAESFLKKAKDRELLDRIMFGSDQMRWPELIERSIKQLDSYDFLSEEDKRKIFYENAVRFLRLTEEDLKRN